MCQLYCNIASLLEAIACCFFLTWTAHFLFYKFYINYHLAISVQFVLINRIAMNSIIKDECDYEEVHPLVFDSATVQHDTLREVC